MDLILAGIDEAGLGPALGPYVCALNALRVPDGSDAATPWALLDDVIVGEKRRGDSRILITDSKVVHGARKKEGLERGIVPFLFQHLLQPSRILTRSEFLHYQMADAFLEESVPWYETRDWRVPAARTLELVERDCASVAKACHDAGIAVAAITSTVLTARKLNQYFDEGLNKSEAVFLAVGHLIRSVAKSFPDEPISLTVDKQGGRNMYLPLLMDLFPGAWIDMLEEGASGSRYRLQRNGPTMDISFLPKADSTSFCVALASMFAKYIRERCMEDLNHYFSERIEGLNATAGYHGDAPRFLKAIEPVLDENIFPRDWLIRKR